MTSSKNILVAPLNWGIGHATRCIPLIHELLRNGHNVILASDGQSLDVLRRNFSDLPSVELPGYSVTYPRNGKFIVHFIPQIPRILRAIREEYELTQKLISEFGIDMIISDNRYGVKSHKIPSIFVTHQLQISLPFGEKFLAKLHRYWISDFTEIWVPDMEGTPNLAGRLSHSEIYFPNTKYLGILSRFSEPTQASRPDEIPENQPFSLAILSGPEPQRSLFEKILLLKSSKYPKQIVIVGGTTTPPSKLPKNVRYYPFLETSNLLWLIQNADELVARSGYSSIMDFVTLGKPAILIPTPGQTEQEYLARYLVGSGMFDWMEQSDFSWGKVNLNYVSLKPFVNWCNSHRISDISEWINRY